jgi:hypothetical protein
MTLLPGAALASAHALQQGGVWPISLATSPVATARGSVPLKSILVAPKLAY